MSGGGDWIQGDGGPAIVLQGSVVAQWQGANDFDNSLMEGGTVETDYDVIGDCEDGVSLIQRYERDMLVLLDSSWVSRFLAWQGDQVMVLQVFGSDLEPEELAAKLMERPPEATHRFSVLDRKLRLMVGADAGADPHYGFSEVETSAGEKICEVWSSEDGQLVRLRDESDGSPQ